MAFPPSLEGKLPAQYGNTLRIPFTPSAAATASEKPNKYRIKTVDSSQVVDGTISSINNNIAELTKPSMVAIGNHYKIQLSCDNGASWSNIGVFKYTSTPTLSLTQDSTNLLQITAIYTMSDISERLYSYRFDIKRDNQLIETSGDLIHNNSINSTSSSSLLTCTNIYTTKHILKANDKIIYSILTINGLVSTKELTISNGIIIPANEDSGWTFQSNLELGKVVNLANRNYYRSLDKEIWSNIGQISADPCIESNQTYYYGYLSDNTMKYKSILVPYEDMFINDGSKQVCIKFNPKVNSFKHSVLESKTNTIGSPYPFIFRNSRVGFKEFQISGLISYLMGSEGFAAAPSVDSEDRTKTPGSSDATSFSTNLTAENIRKEVEFRQEVLDWLTNGQPKLFRSPTEGIFIVSLMNVSLSPNDTLGRMLYTFNATCVEIDEPTVENFKKYGFYSAGV